MFTRLKTRLKGGTALAALLGALLAPGAAEARFGKASAPSPSGSSGSGGRGPSSGGGGSYGGGARYYPRYASPYAYPYPWYYGGYGYYAPYGIAGPSCCAGTPSQQVTTEAKRDEKPVAFVFGGAGQIRNNGPTFGLNLGLEGERFGFKTGFDWISAFTDDGTAGTDNIYLFNAHATYALFANEDGRVRLEGGFNSAFAPNLSTIGPSGGLSVNFRLIGPLGFDGAFHYTPFPFEQIDWTLGGAIAIAPAAIRVGWRAVTLDDRGRVDGIAHRETFSGPYIGLAFVY